MEKNNKFVNSIFESDEWLNIVAKDSWERITVENKNKEIIASFPIVKGRKYGFKSLVIPPLTQTIGVYLQRTNAKLTKRLEKEKKLLNEIINKLPKGYACDFYLDTNNEYFLPFWWNGFKVEPRVTYRITDTKDIDIIWKGLKENIRTDIRKAEKNVEVRDTVNIEILINMISKTFERQGRSLPYDREMIKELHKMLLEKKACKLLYAIDNSGNIHAATYFVFDDNRCYYLMSGGDPKYRNSGATSLLVWEGIKFSSKEEKQFDFEGSMIESIEKFVRGFGAESKVYYHATKYNFVQTFLEFLKPKIKRLIGYK